MTGSVPRHSRTRPLTVFAQDPGTCAGTGEPLLTQIEVPAEQLAPGPCGYRIRVIDYDSSTGTFYSPMQETPSGHFVDRFDKTDVEDLLTNPHFHQQNVYAIAMRVLGRFESALGRHVAWQFDTHQLKIVPHAFREANAFYSRDDQSLMFGYFARRNDESGETGNIFTCLSHDIVAHETTHALLDGLRERFLQPSLPDQAAFHEGFADVVAILSVASVSDLVEKLVDKKADPVKGIRGALKNELTAEKFTVTQQPIQTENLRTVAHQLGPAFPLFSLAEEMGAGLSGMRGQALRNSLSIKPSRTALVDSEFEEPHRRGELLVAAVLRAVISIANERCFRVGIPIGEASEKRREVSHKQLADCLAESAKHLLTICIRALDYMPPVHVTFAEFLTGMLTADRELVANDNQYHYRRHIREAFLAYGIGSSSTRADGSRAMAREANYLSLEHTDHHAMMSNSDEMFRFIWENRAVLGVSDDYYTKVSSVNPSIRVGPDGILLFETVVEYTQSARVRGRDLVDRGFERPRSLPGSAKVTLYGGGTLVFDVRGRLKYHMRMPLNTPELQNSVLKYNAERGIFRMHKPGSLSRMHELRSMAGTSNRLAAEVWR